jgi:hypothetical protein
MHAYEVHDYRGASPMCAYLVGGCEVRACEVQVRYSVNAFDVQFCKIHLPVIVYSV